MKIKILYEFLSLFTYHIFLVTVPSFQCKINIFKSLTPYFPCWFLSSQNFELNGLLKFQKFSYCNLNTCLNFRKLQSRLNLYQWYRAIDLYNTAWPDIFLAIAITFSPIIVYSLKILELGVFFFNFGISKSVTWNWIENQWLFSGYNISRTNPGPHDKSPDSRGFGINFRDIAKIPG